MGRHSSACWVEADIQSAGLATEVEQNRFLDFGSSAAQMQRVEVGELSVSRFASVAVPLDAVAVH